MTPDFSFVMAARNDDFGGDFLHRMMVSLSTLDELCPRHNLSAEIIVVEWNPHADKEQFAQILEPHRNVPLRIITVPSRIHDVTPGGARMPMFEYRAKNVGIRRAKGSIILCTNPDIIFSNALISTLAGTAWASHLFYRAMRSNLKEFVVPLSATADEREALCQRKTANRLGEMDAAGDFMLMSKNNWMGLSGFPEITSYSSIDSYMAELARGAKLTQHTFQDEMYHQYHDSREQTKDRPQVYDWNGMRNQGPWGLEEESLEEWQSETGAVVYVKPDPEKFDQLQIDPVGPEPAPKPRCPNCSSDALGIAGGMKHCNQCGYRF